MNTHNNIYGLIGYPLAQSFSTKYFTEKFQNEGIENTLYQTFEIDSIHKLKDIIQTHPNLKGLNVTIPYKKDVIKYLDHIQEDALQIGACNCIKISNGKLLGYNTDAPAFKASLTPLLKSSHRHALILGTGGAALAVEYVLKQLGISFKYVSRNDIAGGFVYQDLSKEILNHYTLIINCTPLGSFPKVDVYPNIPYQFINENHYLYDLVYNPPLTKFLSFGKEKNATIKNGYDMLIGQAELGWKIWNEIKV